jgi:hypothetical protein
MFYTGMLGLVLFILCIIFCFYLPGRWFLARLKITSPPLEQVFLSTILGVVFFLFIFYILAWLHADLLAIPLYIGIDVLAVREMLFFKRLFEKGDRLPLGIIVIFSTFFSIPLLLLGNYGNTTLYHFDDMLAVALIKELRFRFPPQIPQFVGVQLTSYHFFYDFLLAKISQFFHVSAFSLHFHFVPVFFALSWGVGVYVLVSLWTKNRWTGIIATFLTMFAGSFSYIYYLAGHTSVSFMDGLGISQPAYSVYNPRITSSMIILIFSLVLLYRYLQSRQKRILIPWVLAAGMLPMTDVYAAIVLYSGLLLLTLIELSKRRFVLLLCWGIIAMFFFGTYGVFVGKSGGLIFHPLWAPIGILQAFDWIHYDQRMYDYTQSHNYLKIVLLQGYGLFIFLILNLGTRVFGLIVLLIAYLKHKFRPSLFALILCFMTIVSITIPLLVIQSGKVFEIIQLGFFYLFFCALFAAIGFSYLLAIKLPAGRMLKPVLLIILFVLTMPSTFVIYAQVVQAQSSRVSLDSPYYKALSFLKTKGNYNQTVLEIPPQEVGPDINGMNYWYNNQLPEVSAFAGKQDFLASMTGDFPGTDVEARIAEISLVLQYRDNPDTPTKLAIIDMLKKNKIVYIFSPYQIDNILTIKGIKEIYNHTYVIYQVDSQKLM